jgi:hypothetical protein
MLEGLEPTRQKFTCKVATVRDSLDESDQEIFLGAIIDEKKWGAKTLSNALKERGVALADTVITRHRRRVCRCYSE